MDTVLDFQGDRRFDGQTFCQVRLLMQPGEDGAEDVSMNSAVKENQMAM